MPKQLPSNKGTEAGHRLCGHLHTSNKPMESEITDITYYNTVKFGS